MQVQGASGPSVSAKIERGQRGGYAWELRANVAWQPGQAYDEAFAEAIGALQTADATMRRCFGSVVAGLGDLVPTLTTPGRPRREAGVPGDPTRRGGRGWIGAPASPAGYPISGPAPAGWIAGLTSPRGRNGGR
jgi:hypothetical protein